MKNDHRIIVKCRWGSGGGGGGDVSSAGDGGAWWWSPDGDSGEKTPENF